jgi:hypothetical protein
LADLPPPFVAAAGRVGKDLLLALGVGRGLAAGVIDFLTPGVGRGRAAALATDSKLRTLACRIRRPAPPELADNALSASLVACLLVGCADGCLGPGDVGVGIARVVVGETLGVGALGNTRLLRGSFGVGGSGGSGG